MHERVASLHIRAHAKCGRATESWDLQSTGVKVIVDTLIDIMAGLRNMLVGNCNIFPSMPHEGAASNSCAVRPGSAATLNQALQRMIWGIEQVSAAMTVMNQCNEWLVIWLRHTFGDEKCLDTALCYTQEDMILRLVFVSP